MNIADNYNYYTIIGDCHSRITAKGLLIIIMLFLQAHSFVQPSLLLMCGDIESNPGPGKIKVD